MAGIRLCCAGYHKNCKDYHEREHKSILCLKGCLPLHYREINLNVLLFNEMDGESVAFNKHSMYVELLHHINDVRTTDLSSLA